MNETALPYADQVLEGKKLLEDYQKACDWLDKLGIEFRRTRFATYLQDRKLLFDAKAKSVSDYTDEEFKTVTKRFLEASREMHELVRVKATLSSVDSDSFISQLRNMSKGHPMRGESSSDQSRNFAFELDVASRFLYGGFQVDLNHLADVVVKVENRSLYIECKRVTSPRQFEKRVSSAKKQLKKRLSGKRNAFGIAAFEVSELLQNDIPAYSSGRDMWNGERRLINGFTTQKTDYLSTMTSKNIIGALNQLTSAKFIISDNELLVGMARASSILKLSRTQKVSDFFDKLQSKIGNQVDF
jgi:hypothetical protein